MKTDSENFIFLPHFQFNCEIIKQLTGTRYYPHLFSMEYKYESWKMSIIGIYMRWTILFRWNVSICTVYSSCLQISTSGLHKHNVIRLFRTTKQNFDFNVIMTFTNATVCYMCEEEDDDWCCKHAFRFNFYYLNFFPANIYTCVHNAHLPVSVALCPPRHYRYY